MLNWIEQLLGDPNLREAIGWLAGGVAALASGIWVVVRFFIERRTKGDKSGDNKGIPRVTQKITSSGHAVAAGRDANIGVKGAYIVVLVFFLVAILLFGLSAFGDNFVRTVVGERVSIPAFSLSISCGSSLVKNPYQISEVERRNIVSFVDFIEQNNGEVVYINIRIDQECAACECLRTVKEDSEKPLDLEEPYIGALYIDRRTVQDRKEYFSGWGSRMELEGIELLMFVPGDWAVSHSVFLPRPEHLTESQYRSGEYGTFAQFDGLFTARFSGGTGGNALQLDVLHPSDQQQKQLRCIRDGTHLSALQRLYLGC